MSDHRMFGYHVIIRPVPQSFNNLTRTFGNRAEPPFSTKVQAFLV
jgi:hypothetical protein